MIGILAVLAMAAVQDTNFTETFYAGQNVNLSQSFYICERIAPQAMQELATIKDPARRQTLAQGKGCYRFESAQPAVAQVLEVRSSICGPLERVNGGMKCGGEAHQLVIRYKERIQTVIRFQNDVDCD